MSAANSYTMNDLADHLDNLLAAGEHLIWYDADDKPHPAVTPYMRAIIEEKAAMLRDGCYATSEQP